jgi:hypothetical protein
MLRSATLPFEGRLDMAPPRAAVSPLTMTAVFAACGVLYLIFYALSGPIRYGFFLIGQDNLIFVRDVLIFGPLALLFAAQALQMRVHPAFIIAGILFAFHGLVLMGTIGNLPAVAYGVKMLINLLFGFFMAAALISPEKKTLKILAAIWVITLIGVMLDKFGVTFAWSGIRTVIGGIDVDVSKDWQISDPFARRVAGFARSSISVAALMPCLAIVLACRMRMGFLRVGLLLLTAGVVFLTTQKGAFIAFIPIALALCLPMTARLPSMRVLCLGFIILAAALPPLTMSLYMEHGTGVFSAESLFLRVTYTWPQAWDWITDHQMLIFGVGLGGLGGPQRLYALDSFNPADNIMLLMYYGTVLSILEDQAIPLFLGAAIAVLLKETAPLAQTKSSPLKMGVGGVAKA